MTGYQKKLDTWVPHELTVKFFFYNAVMIATDGYIIFYFDWRAKQLTYYCYYRLILISLQEKNEKKLHRPGIEPFFFFFLKTFYLFNGYTIFGLKVLRLRHK